MEEVAPGSRLQVLAELRDETGPDVIRIGTMLAEALQHWPDSSTLEVVITRERRLHYLARHSEVVDDEPLLIEAVLNPSEIHVNKLDWRIAIVYEALSDGFYFADTSLGVQSGRSAELRLEPSPGTSEGG